MNLAELCHAAVALDASDLILHEREVPVARVRGQLARLADEPVAPEVFDELWANCGAPPEARDFDAALLTAEGERFRANLLWHLGARGAVLRHIHHSIPDLGGLGVPADILRDWVTRRSGFVLVTGPTGSGKSTTLAACLEVINSTASRHVVTIEEPVEYVFTNRGCVFTQRDVGIDTPTFAEGLRQSLRQAPDVIFIGEIRDGLSAVTAIHAAETGHLVLATVHGSGAVDAIDRIAQLLPEGERPMLGRIFAAQLIGVLAQRLLPAEDGSLALATEFFTNVGVTRRYIEEGRLGDLKDFLDRGDGSSCRGLIRSLVDLCKAGVISEATGMAAIDNPAELTRALRGISNQATRR